MSLKALRIVHSPFGGRAMLLEHSRHGLAEVLEAEQDGHTVIKLRRVPQSERAQKLRAHDNAQRILNEQAEAQIEPPPKPPRRPRSRLGKMRRCASGGGA
jgi:hypothetical protein